MRKQLAAAVAAFSIALSTAVAPPGAAETVRVADPNPRCSQAAPLDVKRATFTYSQRAFRTTMRMGDLSKRRTQVFTRFFVRRGGQTTYEVFLVSAFRKGELRTTGRWSDYTGDGDDGRITRGLTGSWDFREDVITIRLTHRLRGQRVDAAAYSVQKGAYHGPPCGDYLFIRSLERG